MTARLDSLVVALVTHPVLAFACTLGVALAGAVASVLLAERGAREFISEVAGDE